MISIQSQFKLSLSVEPAKTQLSLEASTSRRRQASTFTADQAPAIDDHRLQMCCSTERDHVRTVQKAHAGVPSRHDANVVFTA